MILPSGREYRPQPILSSRDVRRELQRKQVRAYLFARYRERRRLLALSSSSSSVSEFPPRWQELTDMKECLWERMTRLLLVVHSQPNVSTRFAQALLLLFRRWCREWMLKEKGDDEDARQWSPRTSIHKQGNELHHLCRRLDQWCTVRQTGDAQPILLALRCEIYALWNDVATQVPECFQVSVQDNALLVQEWIRSWLEVWKSGLSTLALSPKHVPVRRNSLGATRTRGSTSLTIKTGQATNRDLIRQMVALFSSCVSNSKRFVALAIPLHEEWSECIRSTIQVFSHEQDNATLLQLVEAWATFLFLWLHAKEQRISSASPLVLPSFPSSSLWHVWLPIWVRLRDRFNAKDHPLTPVVKSPTPERPFAKWLHAMGFGTLTTKREETTSYCSILESHPSHPHIRNVLELEHWCFLSVYLCLDDTSLARHERMHLIQTYVTPAFWTAIRWYAARPVQWETLSPKQKRMSCHAWEWLLALCKLASPERSFSSTMEQEIKQTMLHAVTQVVYETPWAHACEPVSRKEQSYARFVQFVLECIAYWYDSSYGSHESMRADSTLLLSCWNRWGKTHTELAYHHPHLQLQVIATLCILVQRMETPSQYASLLLALWEEDLHEYDLPRWSLCSSARSYPTVRHWWNAWDACQRPAGTHSWFHSSLALIQYLCRNASFSFSK